MRARDVVLAVVAGALGGAVLFAAALHLAIHYLIGA